MVPLIFLLLAQLVVLSSGLASDSQSLDPTTTLNETHSVTQTVVEDESSSSEATDSPWFTVFAYSPGSPIHLQRMEARGFAFWLGGPTVSYCPWTVEKSGDCPPGNYTALSECSMATMVPGGQASYASPSDGSIAYTMPHSNFMPPDSIACPFEHYRGSQYGILTPSASNAVGFMACPTAENEWRVFLAIENATVPPGDVFDCLPFGALTLPAPDTWAVWEYT